MCHCITVIGLCVLPTSSHVCRDLTLSLYHCQWAVCSANQLSRLWVVCLERKQSPELCGLEVVMTWLRWFWLTNVIDWIKCCTTMPVDSITQCDDWGMLASVVFNVPGWLLKHVWVCAEAVVDILVGFLLKNILLRSISQPTKMVYWWPLPCLLVALWQSVS